MKLEVARQGLNWTTFHISLTPQYPFGAAHIFALLAIDVALYTVLAWYCDKVRQMLLSLNPRTLSVLMRGGGIHRQVLVFGQVMPREYGQRLPVLFFVLPSYRCDGVHVWMARRDSLEKGSSPCSSCSGRFADPKSNASIHLYAEFACIIVVAPK